MVSRVIAKTGLENFVKNNAVGGGREGSNLHDLSFLYLIKIIITYCILVITDLY